MSLRRPDSPVYRSWIIVAIMITLLAMMPGGLLFAGQVPRHLASMAAYLLKPVKDQIRSQSGEDGRALVLKRTYEILQAERMLNWAPSELPGQDSIQKVAEALGIEKVTEKDIPILQRFLDEYHKDPDSAIHDFCRSYKRDIPGDRERASIRNKVDKARTSAWEGLPRSYTIKRADDHQSISLDWDPERSTFSITVRDHGDKSRKPMKSTFVGNIRTKPSPDGKGLDYIVEPAEEPVRPMTEDDLRKDFETIFGEWTDQDGDRWVIKPLEESKDTGKRTGPDPKENAEKRIKALEEEIEHIKNARIYVWKNEETGETVKQTKFKRLKEPFEYIGEHLSVPDGEKKISGLQKEIKDLRAGMSSNERFIEKPPPSVAESAPDMRRISITHYAPEGYVREFPKAMYGDLGRIEAYRVMNDLREFNPDLPEEIIKQLISSWPRPDWIQLTLEHDPETGHQELIGLDWAMKVTYSSTFGGPPYEVTKIHTPYSRSLILTRRSTEDFELRFVTKEFKEITEDEIYYDETYYIEVAYKVVPSEQPTTVELEMEGHGIQNLKVSSTDIPEVYRSEPFVLRKP